MAYRLSVELGFSSAHQIHGYDGECANLHGHNWKIQVQVRTDRLDPVGMGMDFKQLKETVKKYVDQIDHQFLNELPEFKNVSTTAENIAKWFHQSLANILPNGVKLDSVTIWETDKYRVEYSE